MGFVPLLTPVPRAALLKELSNNTFNEGAMLTQNPAFHDEGQGSVHPRNCGELTAQRRAVGIWHGQGKAVGV
jgi:hypothetical protein